MGSGSWLLAQITGPAKDNGKGAGGATRSWLPSSRIKRIFLRLTDTDHESNQADRAISTSKLNALPRLHTWPINVVVFHGSDREYSFRGGFPA